VCPAMRITISYRWPFLSGDTSVKRHYFVSINKILVCSAKSLHPILYDCRIDVWTMPVPML
jgi:hypothetical protein